MYAKKEFTRWNIGVSQHLRLLSNVFETWFFFMLETREDIIFQSIHVLKHEQKIKNPEQPWKEFFSPHTHLSVWYVGFLCVSLTSYSRSLEGPFKNDVTVKKCNYVAIILAHNRPRPLFKNLSSWIFKFHLTLNEVSQKDPTKKSF